MVRSGDVDGFLYMLKSMMSSVPYHELDLPQIEKTYHLIIYQFFLMLGIDTRCEIAVSGGRIDMVAFTAEFIYVIEFKLNGTPEEALKQINDKGYSLQWQSDSRKVVEIGVNFSFTTRTIDSWVIKRPNFC